MAHDFGDLCATGHDISLTGRDLALDILARLEPRDVVGFRKLRVGRDNDGGYVMLDDFDGIAEAYSIGISDDVSWDLAMAGRGLVIHQFDHTVPAPPQAHANFRFRRTGLAATASADGPLDTLGALMAGGGHGPGGAGADDLLLKCDIEGAEWEVFAAIDPAILGRFRQIVMEVHGLRDLHDPGFARLVGEAVRRLTAAHRVVHVHGNNWAGYAVVGGLPVPTVLELTLVRADGKRFVRPKGPFPTPLDMPNNPRAADHALGMFRFR